MGGSSETPGRHGGRSTLSQPGTARVEEGSWGTRRPGFPSTPGSGRRLQEAGHPGLSPRASMGAASGPFGRPRGPRLISLQGTLPSGGAFVYTRRPKPSSPGAAEPGTLESRCQRKAGVTGEGRGAQGQVQGQCWEPASPQGGCLSGLPGGTSSEDSRGGCVYKGAGGVPPPILSLLAVSARGPPFPAGISDGSEGPQAGPWSHGPSPGYLAPAPWPCT